MATEVVYLPPRMDPLGGASTRALREGPAWLLAKDAGTLFKMLHYLPNIFLPFKASKKDDELSLSIAKFPELAIEAVLFVLELVFMVAIPVGFIVLPGFLVIPACSLAYLLICLLCWPLHGPNLCYSTTGTAATAPADCYTDERWIFVNGCMTNRAGLQDNVNRLSEKFGRKVIGIHNKSFGLIADLLECLIQRCFAYKTSDVRIAYMSLKPFLMDGAVKKVVLIGHSQGGLIISLVLDQLLAEIPPENVAKLEIYTFGSAASHMSNPPITSCPSVDAALRERQAQVSGATGATKKQQHVVKHIEHYVNEYDLVPRWGVLHSVYNIQKNRYAGSVFVRRHQSGHMFNQHYLDDMFSTPKQNPPSPSSSSAPTTPPQKNQATLFLDHPVSVDLALATNRAAAPAAEIASLQRKTSSGLEFGNGERIVSNKANQVSISGSVTAAAAAAAAAKSAAAKAENDAVLIFNRTSSGGVAGEEANGRTVKELSRLWRYLGGEAPDE